MIQIVIGAMLTIVAILSVSVVSGKVAKKKKSAGSLVVAGAIMGTLVGGSSTIGTAQLAYQYGMSAWWFTLGAGLGCLILALVYATPLHRSGHTTLTAFITRAYGKKNGVVAAIFSSLGNFINIISQLISATAIIAVIFPKVPFTFSLLFTAVIMVLYIIFGGVKGSGLVGSLKMILLYVSMMVIGILVLKLSGGLAGFLDNVNNIGNTDNVDFYSLFARGVGKDLGACLSLVLGVVTTQSYAQAIFVAKSEKSAVGGALLGTLLIPPIGIGGILAGLYMRAIHPGIISKTALTFFITEYMHPLLSGVVLGTLFIAVVGTGAGLALGISIVLKNDVMPLVSGGFMKNNQHKISEKVFVVLVLLSACLLSMGSVGDTILNFAFMSMGLRGATLFVPLCFAIFYPGCVSSHYITASIITGPSVVLVLNLVSALPFDPLFAGVLASGVIILAGVLKKKFHNAKI